MNTSLTLIALGAAVMSLLACDKTAPAPPEPTINQPVSVGSGAAAVPATDPSVPSAESVFPPGVTTQKDPAMAKTDGTRKPTQEAAGTLLPGQNNDHSAPLSPAR